MDSDSEYSDFEEKEEEDTESEDKYKQVDSPFHKQEEDNQDNSSNNSVKSVTSEIKKMLIGGSKRGKFFMPSVEGTWTNNHGHGVSSYLFLLPSGTERSQLELSVKGKKGFLNYSYPKRF